MSITLRQPCHEGFIGSTRTEAPCARKAGPWVLAATILGSSMAFIDETAVAVALPAVQDGLDATVVGAQWVVEAVAVLAITALHVPESRDAGARGLDLPGAALAAVGLGGTVFGLLESSREGFGDPVVAGSLAGGMAALVAFVLVEGRVGEPMVPLSLFRVRNFAGSNVFTLLLYFALSGTLFFLPFNLIQAQGYSATAAGAAVAPVVVIMFLLSRYTGNLAERFGPRVPLVTGSLVSAAGFVLFAVPGLRAPYWSTFFPTAVALGMGLAILVPALTTVALNSVEARHSGLASAINNSFSQIAGLLAVAVLGVVMFAGFGASLDERLDDLHLPPEARRQLEDEKLALGAAEAPGGLDAGSRAAVDRAIDEAFVSGYRVVMLVATAMALASAVGAALLVEGREKPEEQPEESKPLAARAARVAIEKDAPVG